MIVSGSNKYANPHHYEHPNHKHMVESRYYHEHKPKAHRICGPTKQLISNLEYNILMNNPQYENQTLTSKLFHCGPDEDQCLFKIIDSKRASRVNFRALCPNIYIQKLRIIYLLLLTQSYHPLYNLKLSTSIVTQNFTENNQHNDSSSKISASGVQHSDNHEFKTALNILRVMIYEDKKLDGVRCKYLAEFFQFLQYDFEIYQQKNSSKIKNEVEQHKENIVINILNKYPILDEIFIDILIYQIEKKAEETGGINIDDNYNIKVFLSQSLGLSSNFTSNWEFYIQNINVIIGIDMFTLDYNIYNYFSQIIETLDQNGLLNGLDVSKVGGFDEQVFNRLDMSYILDLKDVLSNCSESRHDQFFLGGSNSLHGSKNQARKVSSTQLVNGSNVSTKYNFTHYNILENINEANQIQGQRKTYKKSENPQSSRNSPIVTNNVDSEKYNQPQVFSKFHHTHMNDSDKIIEDHHKNPQKKLIFIPKNNQNKDISTPVTRPSTNYVKIQNKDQVKEKEQKIKGNSNEMYNQNRYRIYSLIGQSKLSSKQMSKNNEFQNLSEKQKQKRRQSQIKRQIQMQNEQLRRQYEFQRQQRQNQRLKRQKQRSEKQKIQFELERQRERQKIIERQRQRQMEFQKKLQLEREVQRQIEIQKQKQRTRQLEIQQQMKRERQQRQRIERQKEENQRKNKERQIQIQLEKEKQRQFLAERQRQRQKNIENQRKLQVEKILEEHRLKQRQKEKERMNEKQKQMQRQRQKQYELRSNYSGISLRSGNQIVQNPYKGIELNQPEKNFTMSKPTFNVVRHNSNNVDEMKTAQPYFFSRKNSKMTEKNSETFQEVSSINEPNKMINQPFKKPVIKINSNIKYEPIKPMSQKIYRKQEEQSAHINNPTILTTEGAKKFLRQLYQQPQKRTPLKTSEIIKQEQNSKGFIHLRQKITESGRKNVLEGSHEVVSSAVFSQNQQNSMDIMRRVPSTNVYTSHNNVLYSLNENSKMKDSGTFSSTNNNIIYYNNYPNMRKRVQSQIFTNQKDKIVTEKTEGQIMWEKHKMKNSHDPNLFKKQVHSSVQVNAQPVYRNNYNNINTVTSINSSNSISYQPPTYVYKTLNKNQGSSKANEYQNMGTNASIKTQKWIEDRRNSKGREQHKPITLGQINNDKYYRLSSLKSEENGKKIQTTISQQTISNPIDSKTKEKPFYIPEKYQQMNNINLIPHPTYNLNNGTNNTIQNNPYNNSTHNNFNSTNNTTSLSHNNFNTNGNAIHYNNYIPPTNIYTYINPNMKTVPNIHNAHTSYTERPVFNEKSVLNTPINSQSNRPPSYSQLGNNYPSTYGLKL